MRRATVKRSERSPTTEPGFQRRLGLPSAWSQPETRRTTLVRSHSHTSATSLIPLLSRECLSPLAYLATGPSRSLRAAVSLRPFSLVSTVRASLREIFFGARQPPDESWRPLQTETAASFEIRSSLHSRKIFCAILL